MHSADRSRVLHTTQTSTHLLLNHKPSLLCMSVPLLAFPYYASGAAATLTKATITTADAAQKYTLDVAGKCSSISHSHTQRLAYVSNADSQFPLLLAVSPDYTRLKLQIHFSASSPSSSLIILKSFGDDVSHDTLLSFLQSDDYQSPIRDVSEIAYLKFLPSENTLSEYEVIVNDTFDSIKFADSRLNVSVWEHTPHTTEYTPLFSFRFFVQSAQLEPPPFRHNSADRAVAPPAPVINTPTSLPKLQRPPESSCFTVSDFRKAFRLSITDGPEFRNTLARYEGDVVKLRKLIHSLFEDVGFMELTFRRVVNAKNGILDTLSELLDCQFNPLLRRFDLHKHFRRNFLVIFDSIEKKMWFLIKVVLDGNLLSKMSSYLLPVTPQDGSETSGSKKTFQKNSKEYYDWLQKYLSNEKDRPELKLLVKRKLFELSKLDYLNSLNLASNNQYFNQFLENLFKFSSPDFRFLKMDLKQFRSNCPSLLSNDATLYLNSLSRFNSEKLQFRQMIEASASNEELSEVLKLNLLAIGKDPDEDGNSNTNMCASKLDSVFTALNQAIPGPQSAHRSPITYQTADEEQSGEISGILYALGGKGKPGWHKEWVTLKHGQLTEYSDWRKGKQLINKPINIALASVKPTNYEKRHFCFEIMTSSGSKHVFQAINDDDREQWIKALYNAGQITEKLISEKKHPKVCTAPIAVPKPKLHLEQPQPVDYDDETLKSPVSILSNSAPPPQQQISFLRVVNSVENSDNHICADCGSQESVEWISLTFLVTLCVKCSSCHRNMGTHISKVRSLKLDNFENENRVLLGYINNRSVNSYLDTQKEITPQSDDETRLKYIQRKYMQKAFMAPLADQNNILVHSVREINIPLAIKALNCGANANINLQMGTGHGGQTRIIVSLFEYSLRKIVEVDENGSVREYFAISELLLNHGCKLDSVTYLHTELNHTEEARAYWKEKRMRLG